LRDSSKQDVIVELTDVSRVYRTGSDSVLAIKGLSMKVVTGEAVAIMGPSGSGKTTLLNLICGLDRPTSGIVELAGVRLNDATESQLTKIRARTCGLVFQEPHLLPGLTALENVVIARLPWAPRAKLELEARALLDAVGLRDRMNHQPSRLSAGERQRVGIARALMGDPALLIADEPTGNLDARTTDELVEVLDFLRSQRQLTLMVATHDATVAAIADRVVRLVGGQVERDGRQPMRSLPEVRSLT
jgi:putative ABC transport system ATP-binding protein